MRILTLFGSPREKGNTAKVLGFFETIIGKIHHVDRINIVKRNIEGCQGCWNCQKTGDAPGCIQDDDGNAIFTKMMESDVVVYATPLYCWSFSSQMKALLDRHVCLYKGYDSPEGRSLVEGKRTALLVTCDGEIEANADVIQVIFDRLNDYIGTRVIDKYIVPLCLTPGWFETCGIKIAKKMASDIGGLEADTGDTE